LQKPSEIQTGLGHSLDKFFPDDAAPAKRAITLSGLKGEILSFQVVYRFLGDKLGPDLILELSGPLADCTLQRQVGLAAVEHPTYYESPESRIGKAPGYYPDPLLPAEAYPVLPEQTRAVWITVSIPKNAEAGSTDLVLKPKCGDKELPNLKARITVVPATLPKQELLMTHWFHNDCLLSQYRIQAWSREHWAILKPYLENAAAHGINTILTPIFTPPLDTDIGTERPTVQLVDVIVIGKDEYKFGFGRLERWIDLTRRCGVTHFEISHLATQWGAKCAPKIVAKVGGRERRIFGWADSSTGARYRKFLLQFLPQLVQCLKRKKALDKSFLHVSDEPTKNDLPRYAQVREMLRQGAPQLPVLDALSDLDFFEAGLVDRPCSGTDHAGPFLEREVPHLWCYYCCGQTKGVSNRFIDFPSARNRILGWQLFKFGFEGFLQWGYNYWFTGKSARLVDPFCFAGGYGRCPPGDSFMVYPGEKGPIDSLRWEVFREGLQDMRALKLLADLNSHRPSRRVRELLALPEIPSMFEYPRDPDWILRSRAAVNRDIGLLGGKI